MGFFSTIGDILGGIFGGSKSSESHSYNYEPDKVRVAEIERQTKLELADKEIERVELMKEAQIEILKAQALSQAAIEKARAEGMKDLAAQFVELQDKMLEIAAKRMEIIEKCALPIVKEIETFYGEIGDKIQADCDAYNTKKLPNSCKSSTNTKKIRPPLNCTSRRFKPNKPAKPAS